MLDHSIRCATNRVVHEVPEVGKVYAWEAHNQASVVITTVLLLLRRNPNCVAQRCEPVHIVGEPGAGVWVDNAWLPCIHVLTDAGEYTGGVVISDDFQVAGVYVLPVPGAEADEGAFIDLR